MATADCSAADRHGDRLAKLRRARPSLGAGGFRVGRAEMRRHDVRLDQREPLHDVAQLPHRRCVRAEPVGNEVQREAMRERQRRQQGGQGNPRFTRILGMLDRHPTPSLVIGRQIFQPSIVRARGDPPFQPRRREIAGDPLRRLQRQIVPPERLGDPAVVGVAQ
jgi:hypothetical protein